MSPNEKDPTKGLNAAVADVLNGERTVAKWTFDALADESGISKRDLIRKLSTKERHIDIATLERLADLFGLTPLEVMSLAQARQARGNPTPLSDRIRGHLTPRPQESAENFTESKDTGDPGVR